MFVLPIAEREFFIRLSAMGIRSQANRREQDPAEEASKKFACPGDHNREPRISVANADNSPDSRWRTRPISAGTSCIAQVTIVEGRNS